MTKKIIIGRIGDAHGIHGALHLYSYSEIPANIFTYQNFFTKDNKKIEFVTHKAHGDHFIVTLKNCTDRDQALLAKNQDIYIDRSELPPLENGFYWDDLVGLSVFDTHDKLLGVIDHLFATGASDVIAIKGKKLLYVPYLPDVVLTVDLTKKTMIVDWDCEE
jgi:16S rRNA processing protein RimM